MTNDKIYEAGNRIREVRKNENLNQTEFGEKLGVSRSVIKNLELNVNKKGVPENIIKLISATFNVNENWLKTGKGEIYSKMDRQEELASLTKQLLNEEDDSFKNRLISALASLSEEQWKLLADIAEKIVKQNED